MSDYRPCNWCGRSYNFLSIHGPQKGVYCSPKCYRDSGAEEKLKNRLEEAARKKEEERERFNSLPKEQQEAELELERTLREIEEKKFEALRQKEKMDDFFLKIIFGGIVLFFLWFFIFG
jgi:hypothetical protein